MTQPATTNDKNIIFLRRLITTLTATMIAGLIVIIGLFVMRFSEGRPVFPAAIDLPDGKTPIAFTQTADWYAVVTEGDEILIFDASTGELRNTIKVNLN